MCQEAIFSKRESWVARRNKTKKLLLWWEMSRKVNKNIWQKRWPRQWKWDLQIFTKYNFYYTRLRGRILIGKLVWQFALTPSDSSSYIKASKIAFTTSFIIFYCCKYSGVTALQNYVPTKRKITAQTSFCKNGTKWVSPLITLQWLVYLKKQMFIVN